MGRSLVFLIGFIICQSVAAQVMVVETRPAQSEFKPEKFWICQNSDCVESVEKLQRDAYASGYLVPTIQSRSRNDTLFVNLTLGPKFTSGVFGTKNVPAALRKKYGLDSAGMPFSPARLEQLYQEILIFYENSGYPFATVRLDSIVIVSNVFSGRIYVEKGNQIKIGMIRERNGELRSGWLSRYLQVQPGKPFSQFEIDQIPGLLSRLDIMLESSPQIEFVDRKANIVIDVANELSTEIDGILGLQQNPVTGKNLLSGYLDLSIHNLFRSAKMLDLHWERVRVGTQELTLNYRHPGIVPHSEMLLAFSLLKIDTSYLNVESELNWNIQPNEKWLFTLGGRVRRGSVLDREAILDQPESGDFSLWDFISAVEYTWNRWKVGSRLYAGRKRTTGTSTIPPELFDSESGSSFQMAWRSVIGHNQPLFGNLSLQQRFEVGLLKSRQLYFNDYFLIGGLQSIRGFNERSIFTDQFYLLRSELRFSLGDSSYLLGVLDAGRVHDPIAKVQNSLMGFGGGIDLGAGKATRFRLLIAWGKSIGSNIDFSNTKVHIGYLSKF